MLPSDIRVVQVDVAGPKFSAMDSLWKRYVYKLKDEDCPLSLNHGMPPEDTDRKQIETKTSIQPEALREMQEAGRALVGTHDFAAFQSKGGRSETTRTLYRCAVSHDDDCIVIVMEGQGFLYNMCRIITGTLLQVLS